jgi:hypothetical protein
MGWYQLSKIASGYGAWLTPSGKTIEVANMGHEIKAWEILKKQHGFTEVPDGIWDEIFGLGYVRLNYRPFTVTYNSSTNFTGMQKRAIASLIREIDGSRHDFFNLSTGEEKICTDYLCAIEVVRNL